MTAAAADTPVTAPAGSRGGVLAALQGYNFRIYLAGHGLASTGTWMQSIVQDWLVLELTGTPRRWA